MDNKLLIKYFDRREIVIITKHQKDRVIAPLLEHSFSVKCSVNNKLDTDQFGTFSGEIERVGSPLDNARKKIEAGLENTKYTIGVSSEGSFGPHPLYYFIPGNEEIILYYDKKYDLEVQGYYLTDKTNFAFSSISGNEDLSEFILKAGFPSHGIILKAEKQGKKIIFKELETPGLLVKKAWELLDAGYDVLAETDMRAHRNPTRMEAIGKAAENLVENLKSLCPSCNLPGFTVTEKISGLPCRWCKTPTKGIIKEIATCQKCQYERVIKDFSDQTQDPMYCDICNP